MTTENGKADMQIIKTERLANGLTLEFIDQSNRYYGDYHRVRIEARCAVPVELSSFGNADDAGELAQRARRLFGEAVTYSRVLERMGVAGADVEVVKESLIEEFLRTGRSYLERPAFISRFLVSQLEAKEKGRGRLTLVK